MKSLREDIACIQYVYAVPSHAIKDSVNEIILEIEKRIDEFIIETRVLDRKNNVDLTSTLSAIVALKDLKKEMLK